MLSSLHVTLVPPGVILNHLAKAAITFAKKQHTTYRVSELSKTSGQTGLHQIKTVLQDLSDKHLVIAGLGEVGSHVLKNASTMGFKGNHHFESDE